MYRLKSFSDKGEITYSIQKRFFGFLWITLYFYYWSGRVDVKFTNLAAFHDSKFTRMGADNFFQLAVWTKARDIVKARKIKNHKQEYKVKYHKFP